MVVNQILSEEDKKTYNHHLSELQSLHYINDNMPLHLLFMTLTANFKEEMQKMKKLVSCLHSQIS
jgi:hypothetical protein